jgi:uncharacterized protein (TIGR03435 family)
MILLSQIKVLTKHWLVRHTSNVPDGQRGYSGGEMSNAGGTCRRLRRALLSGLAAVAFASGVRVVAQDDAAKVPVFEVATIKPSDPLKSHEQMSMGAGGTFNATASLKDLIERAYGIREDQLEGGPKWMESARYDIVAKSEDKDDPSKMSAAEQEAYMQKDLQRIQALLVDRFRLKFHEVMKDRPVYALVVAKGGPKLGTPKEGEAHRLYSQAPGQLACFGASMGELADELPDEGVSRVVVDKTGQAGRYDFSLRWTPDEVAASGQSTDASGQENQGSLFTALQEQLGLKLVPEKAPVKVMVIDGLDRPSEN